MGAPETADAAFGERFRKSLIWRLPPEAAAALPPPFRVEAASEGSTFVEQIFHEVAAIERRVDAHWRRRVGTPSARPQLDIIVDNLRLGARIGVARGAIQPHLRFALGAALALDDLALVALCENNVLAADRTSLRRLDDAPATAEVGFVGDQRQRPGRFRDYTQALGDATFDRGELTHAAPSEPWRLLHANLLSELMIAFVLLHERAHFALGHLDYVGELGSAELALSEVELGGVEDGPEGEPEPVGPFGARRVLEFQADTQAFWLLATYALSRDGPCRRFEGMMRETGVTAPDFALQVFDFAGCVRVALTAAALACLAFEAAGAKVRLQDPTHPRALARLMNMMVNTPPLSPLVRLQEDGSFYLEVSETEDAEGEPTADFAALIDGVFGMSLVDLEVVAANIGSGLRPLADGAAGPLEPAAWIADLGAFWISDDDSLNTTPVTEAGQEAWALRDVEAQIEGDLRRWQRTRFGAEFTLDIGEELEARGDGLGTAVA